MSSTQQPKPSSTIVPLLPSLPFSRVVVHPLVLLSTVDHYSRVSSNKRVAGVLLGAIHRGVVDVTNSFAGIIFLQVLARFNLLSSPLR